MDKELPKSATINSFKLQSPSFIKRFLPHIIIVGIILIASTLYFANYILHNNPHSKAAESNRQEEVITRIVCPGEPPITTNPQNVGVSITPPADTVTVMPVVDTTTPTSPKAGLNNKADVKGVSDRINSPQECQYYGPQGIQDAIDEAGEGDIISVQSGIYNMNLIEAHGIVINNKTLTLSGQSSNRPTLTSTLVTTPNSTIEIRGSSHVTIENFLMHGRQDSNGLHPFLVAANSNVVIRNNAILHYEGADTDIRIGELSHAVIENNNISSNTDAIVVDRQANVTINNNSFRLNQNVIRVHQSATANITNNTIDSNRGTGITLVNDTHSVIKNNTIQSNQQQGIAMSDNAVAVIEHNTIKGNYDGLVIIGNNFITIIANTIETNNRYGIRFGSGISYGDIKNNLIINNASMGISTEPREDLPPNRILKIINNTLRNNQTFAGQIDIKRPQVIVRNNIVVSSPQGAGIALEPNVSTEGVEIFYNDSYDNSLDNYVHFFPNNTNVSVDPSFVDVSSGNYHLQNSPLRHAGDPTIHNPGEPNVASDMGAYGGPDACLLDPQLPGCANLEPTPTTAPTNTPFPTVAGGLTVSGKIIDVSGSFGFPAPTPTSCGANYTGANMVGVRLTLERIPQAQPPQTLTNENGEFTFTNVQPGTYRLCTTQPQYAQVPNVTPPNGGYMSKYCKYNPQSQPQYNTPTLCIYPDLTVTNQSIDGVRFYFR